MTIFVKPSLMSPKCLQRMQLRLQKYPLKLTYKPGPQMFISDTLSQAALPVVQRKEKFCPEVEETDQEEAIFVTDQ